MKKRKASGLPARITGACRSVRPDDPACDDAIRSTSCKFWICAILQNMNTTFIRELEQLSIAEKRALGEALIVSAESEASAPLITDAQRVELRARLAQHRANPNELGVTFAELKSNLLRSRQ